MRYGWKLALALGFVGAIAMGAVAFGQAGSTGAPSTGTPATGAPQGSAFGQRVAEAQRAQGEGRRARLGRRVVHGDLKVQLPNGEFGTVTIDTGSITAIDLDAKKVTVKRADGQTVTVTATDQTRVRRDGERALLADLKVGDRARIVQIDRGDGAVVRLIGAHSANSAT